ncbi:hypothetical protein AK830_g7315 [Neonectria ditissima]|uniref:Zn(2)-C6 fungal-type domain-containing protein n=1 Tax=Neonectria ditissima TaxID=78410 RepID=A0A0P7AN77_9HYPO|nr:hypothetical protein AK830_g7315 [Neonectria ditissima]
MQNLHSPSTGGLSNIYRRACTACTNSKRRCTKQFPTCQRCKTKGLECSYPATRRTAGDPPEMRSLMAGEMAFLMPPGNDAPLDVDIPGLDGILSAFDTQTRALETACNPGERADTSTDLWFVAWDSWDVEHLPPGQTPQWFGEETLKAYVTTVQGWFKQWVTEDHCPLVHRQLYRMYMPRCIQDAYTALTAYLNKTPSTQDTVFRIIEDRVNQLIREQTAQPPLDFAVLTLADHAARVQALLMFQSIRLFDGDIRMRARAETQIPLLTSWNEQMWQRITAEMRTADPSSVAAVGIGPPWGSWKTWIFAESVRRTWLTTNILQGVYTTMKDGYSACPGGIYCTFGNELWNSSSEHEWEKRVAQGKDVLFMQSLNINDLFEGAKPSHVDEFGHAVMLISFGLEGMERWTSDPYQKG